jgi:hypothetical protein
MEAACYSEALVEFHRLRGVISQETELFFAAQVRSHLRPFSHASFYSEGLLVPRPPPPKKKLNDYTMAAVLDYLFTSGGRFLNPQPEEGHIRSNGDPYNAAKHTT